MASRVINQRDNYKVNQTCYTSKMNKIKMDFYCH